jgi:large subunit ribosomal protein L23
MTNNLPAPYVQKVLLGSKVTEKSSRMLADNQYVFKVHTLSDKLLVKQAVESEYGVQVLAVNILNVKGKERRTGRALGRRKDWKKAYVTLKDGFSINLDAKVKKE